MSDTLADPASTELSPNALPVQPAHMGWHVPGAITSFAGIAGSFLWTESPYSFARINFTPNLAVPPVAGFTSTRGNYTITPYFGGPATESGVFHTAVGIDPRIRLDPTVPALPPRQIRVYGIFTDSFHTVIYSMMLQGLTTPTPLFFANRG